MPRRAAPLDANEPPSPESGSTTQSPPWQLLTILRNFDRKSFSQTTNFNSARHLRKAESGCCWKWPFYPTPANPQKCPVIPAKAGFHFAAISFPMSRKEHSGLRGGGRCVGEKLKPPFGHDRHQKKYPSKSKGGVVCQGRVKTLTFQISTNTIGTVFGWERRAVGV